MLEYATKVSADKNGKERVVQETGEVYAYVQTARISSCAGDKIAVTALESHDNLQNFQTSSSPMNRWTRCAIYPCHRLHGLDIVTFGSQQTYKVVASKAKTYLGKMPSLFPMRPVHQSVSLSVRLIIVMTSPFLKPRSPG